MRTLVVVLHFLICIVIFTSCEGTSKKQSNDINGVYQSIGYGRILKIDSGEYLLTDVTAISCIPLMEGALSDITDSFQYKNDTISIKDGINIYYFTRIEDAPLLCEQESAEYKLAQTKANDPEYNFEVLWENFKDHYAYFELRGVDPETMYNEYRPRIDSSTADAKLFFIIDEMLAEFHDGHIDISATEEIENAAYELSIEKENLSNPSEDTANSTRERLRNYKVAQAVAQKYIPSGNSLKNGNLRWGHIQDNIGYLQINQMMGLASYGISDTLSYRDYWMAYFEKLEEVENDTQDELIGLKEALDKIMKDLATTSALIIDVRFNGGGKDEVGMEVLRRLNGEEKIVFTKKGKLGSGYTPENQVVQPAMDGNYKAPVFLLIGPESASATEIMALSSLSMPAITRIGSNTEGVFSDILDKTLPNGWEIDLSSEVYLDMKGNNYEGIGIPPNIAISYPRETQGYLQKIMTDILNRDDACISKAIELIKQP